MKKLIIIIFLISIFKSFAQDDFQFDKRDLMNFGKSFFYELHYLPTEYPDSVNAIVLFRFSYDLMTFKRSGISGNDDYFYAYPKVDIDFQDSEGIIRSRELWVDTIKVQDYEQTLSKTDFINGFVNTNLRKDQYKITLRFSNDNIGTDKLVEINDSIPNEFYDKNIISKPIFTYELSENLLLPCNLKNNINFSNYNSKIIIPVSFPEQVNKFWYELSFSKPSKNGLVWHSNFDKQGYAIPVKNQLPAFKKSGDKILLKFQRINNISSRNIGYITIDFPAENLVPGYYNLKVSNGIDLDTAIFNFQVIWVEKPFILNKPRYAIEAMYYILTDEEYEQMLNADYEDYSKEILNYWKKQDPSPETPFNESMAEYFRRVDYALFNFKTFSNKNGVKTDKGKIYILFGAPSSIEKQLKDEESYEIWTYKHLNKKFIFKSKSDDNYKLVEILEEVN